MNTIYSNEKKNRNKIETRWNRIEKKHINSIELCHRSDAVTEICKNLIKNKDFIKEHHFKYLVGDNSSKLCLDPNLVMELRHTNVREYNQLRL